MKIAKVCALILILFAMAFAIIATLKEDSKPIMITAYILLTVAILTIIIVETANI